MIGGELEAALLGHCWVGVDVATKQHPIAAMFSLNAVIRQQMRQFSTLSWTTWQAALEHRTIDVCTILPQCVCCTHVAKSAASNGRHTTGHWHSLHCLPENACMAAAAEDPVYELAVRV